MTHICVIALDFDGVILRSHTVKADAFYELFLPHGKKFAEFVRRHHLRNGGMTRYQKFEYYYERLQLPYTDADRKRLDREFSHLVVGRLMKSPIMPGLKSFLRAASKVVDLVVVSAAPEREVQTILRKRGLSVFFKKIYGSPTEKAENLKRVARILNIDAAKILYFGDAINDYRATRKAGVRFFALAFSGKIPQLILRKRLYSDDFRSLTPTSIFPLL